MSQPDFYGNPSGITRDADTVRAVFSAFARRDLGAALEHAAPDCELYLRGTAEITGRTDPYVGHAGVSEYFADAATAWDELVLHADDFRMMPGVVMVLGRVTARRNGVSALRSVMWTWRLREDGKVTSVKVADAGELRDP